VTQFGDGVFDLEASVHLQEEELAVLVEELNGPGVDVAAGFETLTAAAPMARRTVVGKVRRRDFLDRASGGDAEPSSRALRATGCAVRVGENLHLDVTRPREVALDVALVATEVAKRFALGALERRRALRRGH
jgi:hypothetical protein